MSQSNQRLLVFVGSYAEASDPGVYVYELETSTGEFRQIDAKSGMKNPTFVNVEPQKGKLYAISEAATADDRTGEIVTFDIHRTTGHLSEIARIETIKPSSSHIQRDPSSEYLAVSGYHGGNVGLIRLDENGIPSSLTDEQQHEGHGADPVRQDRPHPHSTLFSPDNRYMLVADLGLDLVRTYELNEQNGSLRRISEAVTQPASGPRHLALHPNGNYLFSINEVGNSMTSFKYDASSGLLTEIETVSTLPEGYQGDNTTAEIAVSKDGRFVYGSNRGHDSIVQFQIDPDSGKLEYVGHVSTEGGHPRHFALTPDGDYMIVANRDSNNLVLFRVDPDSGTLHFTGNTVTISKPVCVQPILF